MRYGTSIEERLSARRDQAWARSSMSRMSTLSDRAPVYPTNEHRTKVNPFLVAILAIALAFLWGSLSGTNSQPVSQAIHMERHG
ncbi:hypothetical protein HYR54_14385 [Candidatus Acetothermia bacterium]|nr:hypothetical protein [Candidatus Acetothermia bacterium]